MLPLPPAITSQLDKASIIRLTISYLKLREFTLHGDPPWPRDVSNNKTLKGMCRWRLCSIPPCPLCSSPPCPLCNSPPWPESLVVLMLRFSSSVYLRGCHFITYAVVIFVLPCLVYFLSVLLPWLNWCLLTVRFRVLGIILFCEFLLFLLFPWFGQPLYFLYTVLCIVFVHLAFVIKIIFFLLFAFVLEE